MITIKSHIKRLFVMIILCVALTLGVSGILVGCGSGADYDSDAVNRRIDAQVDYVPTEVPEDIVEGYLDKCVERNKFALKMFGEYTKDVLLYYGEYGDGAHVIYPSELYIVFTWSTKDTVAGCEFRYPDSMKLDVYYDNNIYGLEEAYNKGILSYNDIRTLRGKYSTKIMLERESEVTHKAYNNFKGTNDYIDLQVDYVPTKVPEDIAENYLAAYDALYENASQRYGQYTKDVLLYYGQYGNNAYVIYPSDLYPVFCRATKESVAGCDFRYPNSMRLDVFYGNNIYSLEEAFNNGILSYDEINTLRHRYSTEIMLERYREVTDIAYDAYKESDNAEI